MCECTSVQRKLHAACSRSEQGESSLDSTTLHPVTSSPRPSRATATQRVSFVAQSARPQFAQINTADKTRDVPAARRQTARRVPRPHCLFRGNSQISRSNYLCSLCACLQKHTQACSTLETSSVASMYNSDQSHHVNLTTKAPRFSGPRVFGVNLKSLKLSKQVTPQRSQSGSRRSKTQSRQIERSGSEPWEAVFEALSLSVGHCPSVGPRPFLCSLFVCTTLWILVNPQIHTTPLLSLGVPVPLLGVPLPLFGPPSSSGPRPT